MASKKIIEINKFKKGSSSSSDAKVGSSDVKYAAYYDSDGNKEIVFDRVTYDLQASDITEVFSKNGGTKTIPVSSKKTHGDGVQENAVYSPSSVTVGANSGSSYSKKVTVTQNGSNITDTSLYKVAAYTCSCNSDRSCSRDGFRCSCNVQRCSKCNSDGPCSCNSISCSCDTDDSCNCYEADKSCSCNTYTCTCINGYTCTCNNSDTYCDCDAETCKCVGAYTGCGENSPCPSHIDKCGIDTEEWYICHEYGNPECSVFTPYIEYAHTCRCYDWNTISPYDCTSDYCRGWHGTTSDCMDYHRTYTCSTCNVDWCINKCTCNTDKSCSCDNYACSPCDNYSCTCNNIDDISCTCDDYACSTCDNFTCRSCNTEKPCNTYRGGFHCDCYARGYRCQCNTENCPSNCSSYSCTCYSYTCNNCNYDSCTCNTGDTSYPLRS